MEGRPALNILLGLVAGATLAAVLPDAWVQSLSAKLLNPVGTVFLRLLLVMVLPLATSALVLGILELRPGQLGAVGAKVLGWTAILSGAAVTIGIATVSLLRPGEGMDRAALPAGDKVSPADPDAVQIIVDLFPKNVVESAAKGDMVAVLVFGILFGLALRASQADNLKQVIQELFNTCARAVEMVLKLAPIGVFGLAFALVARTGVAGLLPLARFVGVVLLALAIQGLVVYPLALLAKGKSPLAFFKAIRPALAMAFSTASSAATLPTSLRVAEDGLGLGSASRFVLTVGATGNQNGTALFEGVAVLFLAQLYSVELSIPQQLTVVGVAMLGGIGTAGVPGGAMPVIAAVLASLGIPPEAVGVIMGVDRLLDMCRTTLNVAGDLVIAAAVDEPASI